MRTKLVALTGLLMIAPLTASVQGDVPAEAAPKPKLTLSVARAPIAQTPGGQSNRTVFQGKVTPARPGAAVMLQRRIGARWVNVAKTVQKRGGVYSGMYVARQSETLRVQSKVRSVKRSLSSAAKKRKGLTLRFGENFDGYALNSARWQTRHQDFAGRRMCAKPGEDQAQLLGDGKLTLSIKRLDSGNPAQCKHGRWLNGMIGSKGRFERGTFAARIKFQADRGMHGAFWLQGPSVTGAEIDVAEYFGAPPYATTRYKQQRLGTLIHYTDARGQMHTLKRIGSQLPAVPGILGKKTPGNSYHVYAVEWTPSRYKFYLDGKPILTTNRPFVSRAPSEIVLSLLSSDSELPALTNPNAVMKVDWVRQWK